MNNLSTRSKVLIQGLLALWILIGVAYYRNMNLMVIAPIFLGSVLHRFYSRGLDIVVKTSYLFLIMFVGYYLFISFIFFKGVPLFTNLIIRYIMLPYIAFYWTGISLDTVEKKNYFISCMKWLIFVCSVFGIYEWNTRYNPIAGFIVTGAADWIARMNKFAQVVYYPSSFFAHYTYFAYVLLIGWIFGLVFPFKNRILDYGYKSIIIFALLVSQSRMSWIAFVVITVFYILISVRKVGLTGIFGIPMAVFALVASGILEQAASLISERFSRLFALGYSDGSLGQRFGTLENVLPYMAEHPVKAVIGGGYGSAVVDFLPKYSYFFGFQTTDSMLTTYLIEAGIFGLLIFLVGIVTYIFYLDNNDVYDRSIMLLLIMTLIEMFFFDFFANNITLFLFFMVWGALVSKSEDVGLEGD